MNRFEFLGFMSLSHGIPISVYSRQLTVEVFFWFWLRPRRSLYFVVPSLLQPAEFLTTKYTKYTKREGLKIGHYLRLVYNF